VINPNYEQKYHK